MKYVVLLIVISAAYSRADCVDGECSNSGLEQIPDHRFDSNIEVLNLDGNLLQTLESNAFSNRGLADVVKLNLSRNRITSLEPDAFHGMYTLLSLDLSDNLLSRLSSNTFDHAFNLKALSLNANPDLSLPVRGFQLDQLFELYLSDCRLTEIPADFLGTLTRLQVLTLSSNGLATVDVAALSELAELTTLDLSANRLNVLRVDLIRLSRRVRVDVSRNAWGYGSDLRQAFEQFDPEGYEMLTGRCGSGAPRFNLNDVLWIIVLASVLGPS